MSVHCSCGGDHEPWQHPTDTDPALRALAEDFDTLPRSEIRRRVRALAAEAAPLDADCIACRELRAIIERHTADGHYLAALAATSREDACPKGCREKETGEPHPAHVGRCGLPTGRLGVVSCYCVTPAATSREASDD